MSRAVTAALDPTEFGCAHRAMSADGPRGECFGCVLDERQRLRALLARCVSELEAVSGPGADLLRLLDEARRASRAARGSDAAR